MCFSQNRTDKITLKLYNKQLPEVDKLKTLGLALDRNLTWKNHIYDLNIKCNTKINLIKTLAAKI